MKTKLTQKIAINKKKIKGRRKESINIKEKGSQSREKKARRQKEDRKQETNDDSIIST